MDLVSEGYLPLPDLVSHLNMGNQSGPEETTVDPLPGWSTAESEPGASFQGACLNLHWGQREPGLGCARWDGERSGFVYVGLCSSVSDGSSVFPGDRTCVCPTDMLAGRGPEHPHMPVISSHRPACKMP